MSEQRTPEELRVQGSQIVDRIRDLIHEGNVRRIQIRHDGRMVLEIPVTVAAIGVLIAPTIAALGVLVALATECTIVVERVKELTAGTAGGTWAEFSPDASTTTSAEAGTTAGIAGKEAGGMDVGGQGSAPGEPPAMPDMPEATGEPGQG